MPASAIEMFDSVRKYFDAWEPATKVMIRTMTRRTSQRARTFRIIAAPPTAWPTAFAAGCRRRDSRCTRSARRASEL